jgi:iron complex transport system substrate-binding protein
VRRLLTAAIAGTALLLSGCADGTGGSPGEAGPSASGAAAAYPVAVGNVTLGKRPERIVSLAPTATEILFAIQADAQVVAVDDQSNFPTTAPKSDLSGFKPNAEAIAAKQPDLVIVSNDIDKIVDQLSKLKIPVLVTKAAATLDDTYRQISDLGALTGHLPEATSLVQQVREDIAKVVKDVPPHAATLSYYYELDPSLYTVTSKTFVGSIFALFGLTNVADPADADGSKGGYPQLSQEALIKADPKMIFLADVKCCKQNAASVAARPGWSGISAVKSGQIVELDDDVASRWGPRVVVLVQSIADAVAQVPA